MRCHLRQGAGLSCCIRWPGPPTEVPVKSSTIDGVDGGRVGFDGLPELLEVGVRGLAIDLLRVFGEGFNDVLGRRDCGGHVVGHGTALRECGIKAWSGSTRNDSDGISLLY